MNPNLINQVSPSGRFKRHPLSASLPTMTEIELATLVRSIQRAGQLEDVLMLDDQVLDGWNRVLACELAGVEPRVRLLGEGERAIDSVIGRNFDRRSPTDSVKSIAIVDMYYEINKLDEDSHPPVLRAGGNVAPFVRSIGQKRPSGRSPESSWLSWRGLARRSLNRHFACEGTECQPLPNQYVTVRCP